MKITVLRGVNFENSTLGLVLEPFWHPLGAKVALDAIWTASGAPLAGLLGPILAPRWAKMAPSWPTWRQDVPKMANLEAKMANLAHFWEHFGDLFWILGAILPKMAKTKKTTTVHHF